MSGNRKVLIIEENSSVPSDPRVWSEATTLRDAGWQVTVVCPLINQGPEKNLTSSESIIKENLDGVTVFRFPLIIADHSKLNYIGEYFSALLSISRLSWRIWNEDHFDVLHICNPPDIFFLLAVFYRQLGAKVIFDHHDLFPDLVNWRYRGIVGRLLYTFARVTEYLTFQSANVVISTNQSYRRIALERGGKSADKVIVVRNGPKVNEFVPLEPDPSLKRGFPFLVCYAGVMGYEDGILELIRSIRYIVNDLNRKDVLFILLGDGPAHTGALSNVVSWELENFVGMPGAIHDKYLLRQYLCTANVLLSPEPLTPFNNLSTFIKIGEYMSMGKPIVAYDLVETRITAKDAAVYVEPGDEEGYGTMIVNLLDDPERQQRLGEIGRQRILDHLSWEHQQDDLFRAYAIAMDGKDQWTF